MHRLLFTSLLQFIENCDAATNTERKTTNARTIGRAEGEKDRRQTLEHVRAMRDRAKKVKHVLFPWTVFE
jgi:hypothetical protein